MKSKRCLVFSLIAASTAIIPLSAAFAGFELIAPARQPRVETPAVTPPQDFPPVAEPMPIAPAPEVEAVTIRETGALLQPSRSYAQQGGDFQMKQAVATASSGSVELFIDPYPLQAGSVAQAETSGMDRAMLAQSGQLKGVASSGNRISMVPANGTVQSISRYDGSVVEQPGARYPSRIEGRTSSSNITAMMGGETKPLPPLEPIEAVPVYPEPVSAEPVAYQPPQSSYPAPAPLVPRAPDQALTSTGMGSYAPPPASVAQVASAGFAEAVGFGRDLPLALALSQVVPPEYAFSFATDVNAGESVSWQGGKPWNEVLNDMLAPKGLKAAISGNQVIVQNAS